MPLAASDLEGGPLKLVPLAVGLVLLAGPLRSQSVTAGSVQGAVVDQDSSGLSGAIVVLTESETGITRTTETEGGGGFTFPLVPAGRYELFAEQIGYRPVRLLGIGVAPGARVELRVTLASEEPPVTVVDSSTWGGVAGAAEPDALQGFGRFALRRLIASSGGPGAVASLGTVTDHALRVEGLPEELSLVAVDGVAFVPARHPALPAGPTFDAAFPALGLEGAGLVTEPGDLEWTDVAGGVLHARSVGGAYPVRVEAYGDWSPTSLTRSDFFDPADQSLSSWRAGALVRGSAIRDTAHFALGGFAERLWIAQPRAWQPVVGDSALSAAVAAAGGDLAPYLSPRFVREERAGGFGSFEWQVAADHRLRLWTGVARSRRSEPEFASAAIVNPAAEHETSDVLASVTLSSRLASFVWQELRLGLARSERDFAGAGQPATVLGSGAAFGVDPALPGRFEQTEIIVRDVLHIEAGPHRLKFGLGGSLAAHDQTFAYGRSPIFLFPDAAGLAAGRGFYVRADAPLSNVRFSLFRLGGLLQDRWTVAPGFDVITGIRFDVENLPVSDIALNRDWLARTGLSNVDSTASVRTVSSRIGFRWRVGAARAWLIRGALGVYRGRVDPATWGEVIGEAGRAKVRRGAGALGAWPAEPALAAAPEVGQRLTLIGREYEPPRSSKAGFGISRRIGSGGQISAAVSYRHTDFLLRRDDLNLLSGKTGEDQYGRPVYGTLVKEGGLIGVTPGSNRRFSGFELVSALNPTGYSDYWGITLGLEQPVGRLLRVHASYTYSETTDNWLSGAYGGPYAELTPFPDSLNGRDWADGRSDFDVPHRLAVGLELSPFSSRGVSLAAVYRYSSGLPFTPGFRAGVDANGDGSWTNDPAYVDPAVAGVTELLAAWPCLASQRDQFVRRNSCRDWDRRSLNLRLGLGPVSLGSQPVELWIEALNVVEPEEAVRDHALYLVDSGSVLSTNPAAGRVTVPLVANGAFGAPMAYRGSGTVVRFGVRVGFQ